MALKVSLLVFVQLLISCRTIEKKVPPPPEPLQVDVLDEKGKDLWSPEQRKANANYYFMLAQDRLLKKDRKQADKLLDAAYNLDPNPFLAAKLITVKAYTTPKEAFDLSKKMTLLYPKDPDVNVIHGQLLMARRSFDSAVRQFNKVLVYDDSRIDAYFGLIQANQAVGRVETAITVAREMLKKEGGIGEGWALLAKLYLSKKRYKLALKAAKKAYDLQSSNPEYVHIYALSLELNGKSRHAVGLYETLFRLNPNNDDLIARMVSLYKQIGSLNDALQLLQEVKARSKNSKSFGIDLQIVIINWELRRFVLAADQLEELYAKHKDKGRLAYMAGLGAEKVNRLDRALAFYSEISPRSPYYIHGQYRSVLVFRLKKQYSMAINLAQKIADSSQDKAPDFVILLANLHADLKDYKSAVTVLEKGSKTFKDRTDIWFLLGINYERYGDISACMETMRHIISIDSKHAGAHNYLGYLYAERGENLDEALSLVKRALELKPGDGYYLDSLGWIYYQKKDYTKALEILKDAIKVVPNEGVILEHIADTYKALGNRDQATVFYEKALNGKLVDKDRTRIQGKFREIKKNES